MYPILPSAVDLSHGSRVFGIYSVIVRGVGRRRGEWGGARHRVAVLLRPWDTGGVVGGRRKGRRVGLARGHGVEPVSLSPGGRTGGVALVLLPAAVEQDRGEGGDGQDRRTADRASYDGARVCAVGWLLTSTPTTAAAAARWLTVSTTNAAVSVAFSGPAIRRAGWGYSHYLRDDRTVRGGGCCEEGCQGGRGCKEPLRARLDHVVDRGLGPVRAAASEGRVTPIGAEEVRIAVG